MIQRNVVYNSDQCRYSQTLFDADKFGFMSQQETKIANPERWKKNGDWLDCVPQEQPRRSSPSTAACNWMEEIVNVWNTNTSCTLNVGRVLAYLCNYLAKKEVTSAHVQQALEDAEIHFKDTTETNVLDLIKRAIRCCVAGRTFGSHTCTAT